MAAPTKPPVSAARMAAGMATDRSVSTPRDAVPRAVLLDALGTLLELVPPWPALVRELAQRDVVVAEREARAAMLAEMAYYRAHLHEARDPVALSDLRRRCAGVMARALPEEA